MPLDEAEGLEIDPGLAVCLAPTCDDCEEKDLCFGPEEGPALLRH